MSDDIINNIDALIDSQLDDGEPLTGWDCGDPTFPKCPHCNRHWHGLPITECVAHMYDLGVFDEDYKVAEDDSRVICQGSDFIGPMPCDPNSMTMLSSMGLVGMWSGLPVYTVSSRRYARVSTTFSASTNESRSDTPELDAARRAHSAVMHFADTLANLGIYGYARDEDIDSDGAA